MSKNPWQQLHDAGVSIFDVQVLPGVRCPALSGPHPSLDDAAPIWTVPQPAQAARTS